MRKTFGIGYMKPGTEGGLAYFTFEMRSSPQLRGKMNETPLPTSDNPVLWCK